MQEGTVTCDLGTDVRNIPGVGGSEQMQAGGKDIGERSEQPWVE